MLLGEAGVHHRISYLFLCVFNVSVPSRGFAQGIGIPTVLV